MSRTMEIVLKIPGSKEELQNFANALRGVGAGASNAAPNVAALEKEIANLKEAIKGLKENNHEADSSFDEIQDTMKEFAEGPLRTVNREVIHLLNGMGGIAGVAASAAVGIGLMAAGMYELVAQQAEAAEGLEHLSIKLGLSVGQTEQLSRISKLAGVDIESLHGAARFLANALEDSSGSGKKAADALSKMGIATRTANGENREMGQILVDVIQKLGTMENASQRAFMAQQLLPRGAAQEILILADKYKESIAVLQQYGLAVDENMIKRLAGAKDQINALGVVWDAFKLKLADKIEPIVIPFIAKWTNALSDHPERTKVTQEDAARYLRQGESLANRQQYGEVDPVVGNKSYAPQADASRRIAEEMERGMADLSKGAEQATKFAEEYSRSLDGMKKALEEGKKKESELASKAGSKDLGSEAQSLATTQYQHQLSENTRLEATIKKAEEYKSLMQRYDDMLLEAQKASMTAFEKIDQERKELEHKGLSANQANALEAPKVQEELQKLIGRPAVTRALNSQEFQGPVQGGDRSSVAGGLSATLGGTVGKEIARVVKDNDEQAIKDVKLSNERFSKELKEEEAGLAQSAKALEAQLKVYTDVELKRAQTSADVELVRRQRARSLTKTPGSDSSGDIASDLQLQIQLAKQLAAIQAEAADKKFARENDALNLMVNETNQVEIAQKLTAASDDRELELLRVRTQLEESVATQKIEAQNKLDNLQDESLAKYRDASGKIFDALIKGPDAMRNALKDFALGQAKAIFSNIIEKPLQELGSQAHDIGGKSGFGGLLTGTIFQPKPASVSLDTNTTALGVTTQALNSLTTAITGSPNGAAAAAVNPNGLIGAISDSDQANSEMGALTATLVGGKSAASLFGSAYNGPNSELDDLAATIGGGSAPSGAYNGPNSELDDLAHTLGGGSSSGGSDASTLFGQKSLLAGAFNTSGDEGLAKQLGSIAGVAGAAVAGGMQIAKGIQEGGARGALSDVSGAATLASTVFPPAAIVALGANLVSALLPDPRVQRQRAITAELTAAQYNPPAPISISETTGGLMDQTNYRGQNQIINARPTIGTFTSVLGFNPDYGKGTDLLTTPERYVTPGALLPAGGQQPTTQVIVQVSAMDSKGFQDRASDIASAVRTAMQGGHPLNQQVQNVVKPH